MKGEFKFFRINENRLDSCWNGWNASYDEFEILLKSLYRGW